MGASPAAPQSGGSLKIYDYHWVVQHLGMALGNYGAAEAALHRLASCVGRLRVAVELVNDPYKVDVTARVLIDDNENARFQRVECSVHEFPTDDMLARVALLTDA